MDKETKEKFVQVSRLIEERAMCVEIVCWIWHLVSNLVKAYQHFEESDTPESEALARWEMNDAREDLSHYLHKQGFTPMEILEFERFARMGR